MHYLASFLQRLPPAFIVHTISTVKLKSSSVSSEGEKWLVVTTLRECYTAKTKGLV